MSSAGPVSPVDGMMYTSTFCRTALRMIASLRRACTKPEIWVSDRSVGPDPHPQAPLIGRVVVNEDPLRRAGDQGGDRVVDAVDGRLVGTQETVIAEMFHGGPGHGVGHMTDDGLDQVVDVDQVLGHNPTGGGNTGHHRFGPPTRSSPRRR